MAASSQRRRWTGTAIIFLLACAAQSRGADLQISQAQAQRIGQRIWQNECGGTIPGLTSWNEGENFASLGIGHFIWYPRLQRGPFEESFPNLLAFISVRGKKLPAFLSADAPCPWNSRAEFQRAQNSETMKQLRTFLASSIELQAQFLVARLQGSLPKMLAAAPPAKRDNIARQFDRVGATGQGCYALIDYVNFKGEGTLPTERYKDQGWGLLQALENMRGRDPQSALDEFADSAKTVLRRRIANSPPARGEARWLNGWLRRVDSYRDQ